MENKNLTALQKAIEEIKIMAGVFEHQRIPAVALLAKIIPLLEMEKEQTEIPDDEILKAAKESRFNGYFGISVKSFELGARWYREQLKQRQ